MVAVPRSPYDPVSSHPHSYSEAPAAGSASSPATALGIYQPKKEQDWKQMVAAGAVIAGGVLMVTGQKRAGLAVAAVGTMVALLDEPEAMEGWWKGFPEFLKGAEQMLGKVEGYIDEASKQGRRIQSILHR